jgi:hypothetical protein
MEKDLDKRFYVPSIEEFHVGFEYENKLVDGYWNWNGDTDKVVFTKDTNLQGIIDYPNLVLVKHLDREDIESFHKKYFYQYPFHKNIDSIEEIPFKYDNNAEPTPGRTPYECPKAYLMDDQLHSGQLWILYHYSDGMVWIEYVKDSSSDGYLFRGFIKNKSELKRILTQIGVI